MHVFGIDIGGSGIKGAPVDVGTGKLLEARKKFDTPRPSTPDAVAAVARELVTSSGWTGPIGSTFPGIVMDGTIRFAPNMDQSWIGTDAVSVLGKATGSEVTAVLNDADAAGVAEVTFGAGAGVDGTVLMVTFGTGIGSALFTDGHLVRNTEFGHVEIKGHEAESRTSDRVKTEEGLSWKHWARRVDEYLQHMEALLSPNLIIIGGGVSKQSDKFVPLLTGVRAKVVPAAMLNDAGIVGAALTAAGPAMAAASS
jgi:polyphosphate glucokinase